MPIPFKKFIKIISSVAGGATASARELITRLFTTNDLIPVDTIVEFPDADSVGVYFGITSEEYLQAVFYFGFISKLSTSPSKISYARWAETAAVPTIRGTSANYALADFTAISDGAFTITLGAITEIITGLDFSANASLADVATTMQAAIIAANVDPLFTGSTVTYNATASRFDFDGGVAGDAVMDITPALTGTEIAPVIGWVSPGVRFSNGSNAQTITEILIASTQLSNNFGSFAFIFTLTEQEIIDAATWNKGENVKFIFLQKVLAADAQSIFDAINLISGTAVTLYDGAVAEFPWLVPGMIMAATPYQRRASVQNYMYQVFALTPSVSDAALSDFYDDVRTNYYGETQQAGSNISFYQRGFLTGIKNTDLVGMGIYANEVFLKDSVGVAIINFLLAVSAVSASSIGVAQVLATIQPSIENGLFNGIISVGKTLNPDQIRFITNATGDENAFLQVQNIGYWIDAVVVEISPIEFSIDYVLIYSKNDAVRAVNGSHSLI